MTGATLFTPDTFNESNIIASSPLDIEDRVRLAVDNLKRLLKAGWHFNIACSYGKDSSVSLHLCLLAMLELKAEGIVLPEAVVVTSNTGVENPEIDRYARSEAAKLRRFVDEHGLPVTVDIVTPNLSNNYLVSILGGRTIASLPDGNASCSMMMKVEPIKRHKRQVLGQYGNDRVCTIIGKRLDESESRRADMIQRGESATDPVKNEAGEYLLSPIMHFSVDDLYTVIGYVKAGMVPETYTDFDEMLEIYRGANGGSCELAAHGAKKVNGASCGARFGCYVCTRVQEDRSAQNQVKEADKAYLKPLLQLREVILANHYDPYRRNWISRTVNADGSITISPVAYSPDYCLELLRYCLTIDADERDAAAGLGIAPRFQLLSEAELLAVEYLLSRYGYTDGFEACRIYKEIAFEGRRYPLPEHPVMHPRRGFPEPVSVPFADEDFLSTFSGLRDLEAAVADCEDVVEKRGRLYSGGGGADEFRIDEEGAELFFGFELDYALKRFDAAYTAPGAVVHYLHRLGVVQFYKGSHSRVEKMLQVSNQIHRLGLRPILHDRSALIRALSGREATGQLSMLD